MVTQLLSGKQLGTLQALSSWLEKKKRFNFLVFKMSDKSYKTLLIVEIYG